MQSLQKSIDTLRSANHQLEGRMRDALAVWRDQTSRQFTETYWVPLESLVSRTEVELQTLSKVIDDVRRDCQNL